MTLHTDRVATLPEKEVRPRVEHLLGTGKRRDLREAARIARVWVDNVHLPHDPRTSLAFAKAALLSGDARTAKRRMNEMGENAPNTATYWVLKARIHLAVSRLLQSPEEKQSREEELKAAEGAISSATSVAHLGSLSRSATLAEIDWWWMLIYLEQGQHVEATRIARRLSRLNSDGNRRHVWSARLIAFAHDSSGTQSWLGRLFAHR